MKSSSIILRIIEGWTLLEEEELNSIMGVLQCQSYCGGHFLLIEETIVPRSWAWLLYWYSKDSQSENCFQC
jgi:hypothetical protein